MRAAIIGCGNITQVHAWSLSNIEHVQIVAFADCKLDKAKEMSSKYTNGQAEAYEDYIEMLKVSRPDVVHICTPHYLHVPMAICALNMGINVFMEKPPAISSDEFDELVDSAKKTKAKIGFCFQNRYNATTLELDKLVDSKELGQVVGVRGFVTWKREADYYADDWHGSLSKEGGGVLINQSIHTLDLMLRYLGEPTKVAASMQNHHLQEVIEVEDTLEAWMEFEAGRRASFYATTAYATDAPVILELTMEKGRITMIDQLIQVKSDDQDIRIVTCEPLSDGIGKSYWGRGHLDCISDYYECLKTGSRYKNDIDGISNTLHTTMKIYDAARKLEKGEGI